MNSVNSEGWAKPLFPSKTSKSSDSQQSTFMAPASVTVTSSVPSNPVSLSLVKISYCTTPASHSNMLWNHLPFRDGMFAVFDTDRRRDNNGLVTENRVLKLVCKSEQLERIDLDALMSQALLDEKLSESQQIPDQDLRILVIVKKPLLALRYQLPDEQIRRVQLNFKPESGFDYAINTLRSIGLPIRVKTGTTSMPQPIRPQSAQATFPGQSHLCSQDRYRELKESQSFAPPSAQPAPSLAHVSSQSPICLQQSLIVSGIDQDEFSRPLLPTAQIDTSSRNSRPGNGLLQAPPASSPNPTQQYDVSTAFRHVSTHIAESKGFNSQTNPFNLNSTRPNTTPGTQSERFEPDTIPLSQMLPPDRVLPFPEEEERSLNSVSNPTQVSQQRAGSSTSASTKLRPKQKKRRTKDVEAKVPIRKTDAPTAGHEYSAAGRAKTSWSLKPSSPPSSSATTLKLTVVEEIPSKMTKSEKDKMTKMGQLANGPWTLTKSKFLQHFNEEAYGGPAFMDELNKFSKIQNNFIAAFPLILAAQQSRRGCTTIGHRNQYTDREWLAIDVKNAMSAHQESLKQLSITNAPVRKANTPRKRVRTISPTPEQHQGSIAAVTDQVAVRSLIPDVSPPSLSRVTPIVPRKRAGAAIKRYSTTPEVEIANARAKSAPALTQHTPVATADPYRKLANIQKLPANSQTNHVQVVEQQIPIPPCESSQGPDKAKTDFAVDQGRQTTAAPTTNAILPLVQPAELVSSLDDWIRSYQSMPARPAPAQSAMEVLAEYAAQDDETRATVIDDMICECLADENFEKLVEDVQGAWMRIGLGF